MQIGIRILSEKANNFKRGDLSYHWQLWGKNFKSEGGAAV